jgi:uncharacterized membrane protein
MSKRNISLLLLLVIIAIQMPIPVNSQVTTSSEVLFDPITIYTHLQENGTTLIIIDASLKNQGTESLSEISLSVETLQVEILIVQYNGNTVPSYLEQMDRHTMIIVQLSGIFQSNETAQLHVELLSEDLQSNAENSLDNQSFQRGMILYIRPHSTHRNLTLFVFLPEYTIPSNESQVPIFPQADSNFTENGSIVFLWQIPILQAGQELAFIVKYQGQNNDMLATEDSLFWNSFFVSIGVILGGLGVVVTPKLIEKLKNLKVVPYSGLTNEERMIVGILSENGGSCSQQDIYKEMDISPSKLSQVLNNLEERILIKRVRNGRSNMIHLIE